MRAYLIDEISSSDMGKINGFLKQNAITSKLDQIFWVLIPEDLLNEAQFNHRNCQPHAFAVELGQDWVRLEFLVRSQKDMRCTCSGYCTPQQMDFIIRFAHGMLDGLGIKT